MRSEGDLIPNSDILIIFEQQELDPPPWEYADETQQEVREAPTGANFTFVKTDNQGNVYTFRTDTGGDYKFRGSVTLIDDYNGNLPNFDYVTESLDLTVAAAPVQQITQTQVLERNAGNCSNVGVKVTANYPFNRINGLPIPSTTEYVLQKGRQEVVSITIEATDPAQGTNTLLNSQTVPNMGDVFAYGDYLEVEVTKLDNATPYQYNFGTGYQDLNKFTYPSAGLYVIQVRDYYGCIKQVQYQAEELPVVEPTDIPDNFYISKGNSLRYIEQVEHNDCSTYKTDENTNEEDLEHLDLVYEYNQRVKKCNDLTTQFKSNWTTHTANYYNITTGVGPIPMTVEKVKSNLLAQDQRPYFRHDDDLYTYIYFDNGLLPWFYIVGSNATINGEQRQIVGFAELDEQNALSLKVAKLSGSTNAGTINYVYNKQDMDYFEFKFPASTLGDGCYYIELIVEKDSVIKTWKTPQFKLDASFENSADIMYYGETNTDIYYSSGIKNFLTVGLDYRIPVIDTELQVVKADKTNYLKSSFNVEKFEIKFEPMTLEQMRKVIIALCHQKLFIDSVGYAVENLAIDVPNNNTNLYAIICTLVKSEYNVQFVSSVPVGFTWASGQVTFDNSITIDRTTL